MADCRLWTPYNRTQSSWTWRDKSERQKREIQLDTFSPSHMKQALFPNESASNGPPAKALPA